MTKEQLEAFETDIAAEFNAGNIRAPVHLSGGNADQLIEIFKEFKQGDYVFSTWRSHWHALLAGVPPDKVRSAIMAGRSISLNFPDHRFYSSAIVAGCCPIALGVAWQLKRQVLKGRAWCFIGDMANMTGLAQECMMYAAGHQLPIRWVIENNGKSVTTDTNEVWGFDGADRKPPPDYIHFRYSLPHPHAGAGVRVQF